MIELWFNRGDIFGEGYFVKKENIGLLVVDGTTEDTNEIYFSKGKFDFIKKYDCSFLRLFIKKDADGEYNGNDSSFKGMTNFESMEKGKDLVAIYFFDKKGKFAEVYLPYEEGEEEYKNIYQETEIKKDGDLLITVSKN